ncbi:peroxisomal coenzyme A diphosphatase NUDT7-like [Saccoglossus kowalevskii]|uniref:Peroxisomal coenzyme A diphosphatase NUDT7-like n=1 Tax=Saccoglossus kowalevskii TaxID=10224 RepID=A0ABM0GTQ9_SACKO|nr:PREDICTED: peroxisomal coenzyme A diphosphatase NUDT7-like [Saccoglossus kowalevskii]
MVSRIARKLKNVYNPDIARWIEDLNPPKSAVLVPLFFRHDDLRVLFTVRAAHLRSHGGEVTFPGGKANDSDANLTETALREAGEEIGLPKDSVKSIVQAIPCLTNDLNSVAPVIGFIDSRFEPVPNRSEVSHVFSMPLVNFLSKKNIHCIRQVPLYGNRGSNVYFKYKDNGETYTPSGITAWISIMLASYIFDRSPDFKEFNQGCTSDDPQDIVKHVYNMYARAFNKNPFEKKHQ